MQTGGDAVQISMFDLDSWFGKTCQELSAPTKGRTSRQSSKKRSGSSARDPADRIISLIIAIAGIAVLEFEK